MKVFLFIFFQKAVPQHTLSRLVGMLAESKTRLIKFILIRWFSKQYQVNMEEAIRQNWSDYESFNDFFCRELKSGARPIDINPLTITSPADGAISQLGKINQGQIFQAKGKKFSTEALLSSKDLALPFVDGNFVTIYLSPKDYHRVHMPIDGRLTHAHYIPGKLFSVNAVTTNEIDQLFAINERLVCVFDTNIGPVALVLVGALIVASIETVWCKEFRSNSISQKQYTNENIYLKKGEEMGRFKLGSTVIVLFPKDTSALKNELQANSMVQMGSEIATIQQDSGRLTS